MRNHRNVIYSLAIALALAPAAIAFAPAIDTTATAAADEAATARLLVDAVRAAEPNHASLDALAKLIASHRTGLTPEQADVLARGGPVAPNHAQLVDEIAQIRADASLTPAQQGYQIARAATQAQARVLGLELPEITLAGHLLPSDALQDLARSASRTLTPDELADARGLDALPAPEAAALARVIDAYVAMNDASGRAIHHAAPGARPDWSETLAARIALIDATQALRDVLDPSDVPTPTKATSHNLYQISLTPTDDTYGHHYPFSLDAFGNDRYENNAGGNWYGNCDEATAASAFLDLDGSDEYAPSYDHNPGGPPNFYADHCGKAGGANGGVGFLLDQGGSNTYGHWQNNGINGGANGLASLGALISIAASGDEFNAHCTGTNGGATNGGVALLLTTPIGPAHLDGGCNGSNGGANNGGIGMMIHAGATYGIYEADSEGTNGGARNEGSIGFAYGMGPWTAGSSGTNGGATNGGQGTLITLGGPLYAGQDGVNGGATGTSPNLIPSTGALYGPSGDIIASGGNGANGGGNNGAHGTLVTATCRCTAGSYGTNGGGNNGGTGFLYAADGSFVGGSHGVNGGASGGGATGMTLVVQAYDVRAGESGTNGGAHLGSVGVFINAGIFDTIYTATNFGTNGGGMNSGVGLLIDAGGDDTYYAGYAGTNGGGNLGGIGMLLDLFGGDRYDAGGIGSNGGGSLGMGLLLDALGEDAYHDPTWTCTNPSACTKIGKEGGGFLIDAI